MLGTRPLVRRPTNHGAATRACIMDDPARGTNCIYMPAVRHLSPQCPDQNHKMHEIWSVDSQESYYNCCHQMSDFKAKMHLIRFPPAGGAYSAPPEGAYSAPPDP